MSENKLTISSTMIIEQKHENVNVFVFLSGQNGNMLWRFTKDKEHI